MAEFEPMPLAKHHQDFFPYNLRVDVRTTLAKLKPKIAEVLAMANVCCQSKSLWRVSPVPEKRLHR